MKNIIWRSRASLLLGVIVALLPFLGFPQGFKDTLFVVLGLLIALFGFAKSHYAENYDEEIKPSESIIKTDSTKNLSEQTNGNTN